VEGDQNRVENHRWSRRDMASMSPILRLVPAGLALGSRFLGYCLVLLSKVEQCTDRFAINDLDCQYAIPSRTLS
jgi:hypothetical protein